MKTKTLLVIAIVLFVIIIAGLIALFVVPSREPAQNPLTSQAPQPGSASAITTSNGSTMSGQAQIADLITVTAPLKNATVSSPLTIAGTARGTWYFEASAPVELKDAAGHVIAQGHVTAQGDWMTEGFVPFTATLTFTAQLAGSTGTLVLQNDNPSGDPSRGKELEIPVKF